MANREAGSSSLARLRRPRRVTYLSGSGGQFSLSMPSQMAGVCCVLTARSIDYSKCRFADLSQAR